MNRGGFEAGDTLVVIDDDQARRAEIARQLSGPRRRVLTPLRDEVLGLVSSTAVDLAVIGVHARVGGGMELLRQLRARSVDVEAVVVTESPEESLLLECLRHGAVDVLQIPRDALRLMLTVDLALERRRLVETEALYEASRAILDARPPEQLAASVSELLRLAIAADEVVLLVPGPDGSLEPVADVPHEQDPQLPVLVRRAASLSVPLILGRDECTEGPFRHRLLLPLRADSVVLGVIAAARRDETRPFRGRDLQKAAVLGAQAQLALENARLTQDLVKTERLAAMADLISGVAHEINNPISFARSNLAFVARSLGGRPEDAEPAEDLLAALRDAEHGLERIVSLVHDLRALGRVDPAALVPVNVKEALSAAMRIAGSDLKKCELRVEVPDDLAARSERGRLAQVMVNLLINAAQAVTPLPPERRILSVTARAEAGDCVLEVADQGPGIPAELREKIFEPFFTTRPAGRSTGLGLTLARRIVESQGGSMALLSEPGAGARFEVRLPRDERRAG